MRKNQSTLLKRIAQGFALTVLIYAAATAFFWDSPPLWEFFLYENLPYYKSNLDERFQSLLPWVSTPIEEAPHIPDGQEDEIII